MMNNNDHIFCRFRVLKFDDNARVSAPKVAVLDAAQKPKTIKDISSGTVEYPRLPKPVAAASSILPQLIKKSKSSSEIIIGKPIQNKVSKKHIRRSTISVEDIKRAFLSINNGNLIKDHGVVQNRKIQENVNGNRNKTILQNHHKWQDDIKVVYTRETTKLPHKARSRSRVPPQNYGYESRDPYQQNVYNRNATTYYQSSGDQRPPKSVTGRSTGCNKRVFCGYKRCLSKRKHRDRCPAEVTSCSCFPAKRPCIKVSSHSHFRVVKFPRNNKGALRPRHSCSQTKQGDRDIKKNYLICRACSADTIPCRNIPTVCHKVPTKCSIASAIRSILPFKFSDICNNVGTSCKSLECKPCLSTKSCKCQATLEGTAPPMQPFYKRYVILWLKYTKCYLKYIFFAVVLIVCSPFVAIYSLCRIVTYPMSKLDVVPDCTNATEYQADMEQPCILEPEKPCALKSEPPRELKLEQPCVLKSEQSCFEKKFDKFCYCRTRLNDRRKKCKGGNGIYQSKHTSSYPICKNCIDGTVRSSYKCVQTSRHLMCDKCDDQLMRRLKAFVAKCLCKFKKTANETEKIEEEMWDYPCEKHDVGETHWWWLYGNRPQAHHYAVVFYRSYASCARCCIMVLSCLVWCPFMFFMTFLLDLLCRFCNCNSLWL